MPEDRYIEVLLFAPSPTDMMHDSVSLRRQTVMAKGLSLDSFDESFLIGLLYFVCLNYRNVMTDRSSRYRCRINYRSW
jgi:hypothetical protein